LTLRSGDVQSHLLRSIGAGADYWTMPTEQRLTFARATSPDPFSAGLVASFRASAERDPEQAALRNGGRLLELGCGVAGRLLTCLQAFPNLTAVGIELADDLADEAERRAVALGVADRLTVVRSDAGAYLEPDSFEFGFWSQFFFPEESRRSALTALFANLRSGGIAWAPVFGDFPAMQADPTGQVRRGYALFRVILDSWRVPERSPDQLAAEFESAGFTEVRQGGGGAAGPVRLTARKP
jgi:Methyltransferase domain